MSYGLTKSLVLHVWGCPAEARPYRPNEKNLDSRNASFYFVGYFERSKDFKFYDPSSKSFFETGNTRFLDDDEFGRAGKEIKLKILSLRRNLFLFLRFLLKIIILFLQLLLRMIRLQIYKKNPQSKMKNLFLFMKSSLNNLKNKCH